MDAGRPPARHVTTLETVGIVTIASDVNPVSVGIMTNRNSEFGYVESVNFQPI